MFVPPAITPKRSGKDSGASAPVAVRWFRKYLEKLVAGLGASCASSARGLYQLAKTIKVGLLKPPPLFYDLRDGRKGNGSSLS